MAAAYAAVVNHDMPVHCFFWDLETTGVPSWNNPPCIMEIAVLDGNGRDGGGHFCELVNPGPHARMDPRAAAVTGMAVQAHAHCRSLPAMWADVLAFVHRKCAPGHRVALVGYNSHVFDAKVLVAELVRFGLALPADWLLGDLYTHVKGAAPSAFAGRLTPSRKLTEVYRAVTGEALVGAHSALTDARAVAILVDEAMLESAGSFRLHLRPWRSGTDKRESNVDVQPERWCELRALAVSGKRGTQTLLQLHGGDERAARDAGLERTRVGGPAGGSPAEVVVPQLAQAARVAAPSSPPVTPGRARPVTGSPRPAAGRPRGGSGDVAAVPSKHVRTIRGVGDATVAALKTHGITTVEQLRLHVQGTLHGQWAEVEAYLAGTLGLKRTHWLRVVFDEVMVLPAVAAV